MPLGEVVDCLDSLRRPIKASDRLAGPYPYYGASGVVDSVDDYIFDGEYALVAEDGENLRTRKMPIAFLARGQFWVNNHAHVLAGTDRADVRYVAYQLEIADISGYLSGSTQPKLTKQALFSVPFNWPPLAQQCAIAEVLGALDDKIEGNIKIAARLYSLLRASLDEALQFGDGRTVRLGQVAEINPLKFKSKSGQCWYVDIASVSADARPEGELISWSDAPGRARRAVRGGDTIWSTVRPERRAHALVLTPPENMVVSTGFAVLSPKRIGSATLYGLVTRPDFVDFLVSVSEGSAYPAVRSERFGDAIIPLPDASRVKDLEDRLRPLAERADAAHAENTALARLRNSLLPALMSGELRVREAADLVSERTAE